MFKRLNWKMLAVGAAVLAVAGGAGGWWFAHRAPAMRYVTARVTRGDVVTTITASGSVNPVVTVEVGTYVSGTIQSLYCDYNTSVRKGQLCAKIDPKPYQVVVDEDQAALATARAQLVKDRANLAYAKLAHERADLLFKQDSGSRDAADAARNAYDQAVALVGLDAATVDQKAALLRAGQINLDYTNIVSPVDGTVVSRNVTAGQTVAASLQTPTLFLIATDLTKMQVDANVSESDVGGAVEGAGASFTVDAFPDRVFHGQVAQVRQAPVSVQNVITYDVVITVANPDLKLKPGMTATTSIVKAQALGVLRVPSQALRFTPTGLAKAAATTAKPAKARRRVVWVARAGKLVAVPVVVGLDDDTFAEITSGDLKLGDQVVISEAAAGKAGRSKAAATPSLRL
jgi:HlyD family secretion protein